MYYSFKLNVGAKIASVARANNDISYIKNDLVYFAFNLAYDITPFSKNLFYVPIKSTNINKNEFENELKELKTKTFLLYELYNQTLAHYFETGRVLYSEEFLQLTSECGKLRKAFERSYPNILESESISDAVIFEEYSLTVEGRIGTGITHLRKAFKMFHFIDSKKHDYFIDNLIDFYYNSENEHILIEAKSEFEAKIFSEQIEKLLNNNKIVEGSLGLVKIVPIYDVIDIDLSEMITEIEYSIVYPNPISDDINNDLLSELVDTNGEFQTTKISAPTNSMHLATVLEKLKELGKWGYLKNISTKTKNRKQKIGKKIRHTSTIEGE